MEDLKLKLRILQAQYDRVRETGNFGEDLSDKDIAERIGESLEAVQFQLEELFERGLSECVSLGSSNITIRGLDFLNEQRQRFPKAIKATSVRLVHVAVAAGVSVAATLLVQYLLKG